MSTPWIVSGQPQLKTGNPGVADLYKSENVFVNGVSVVLYAPPGESPQEQIAHATAILLDDQAASVDTKNSAKDQMANLVKAGVITPDQAASAEAAIANVQTDGNTSSGYTGSPNIISPDKFTSLTTFPDSLVLTQGGTTLATMIRKVSFPNHNIVTQKGLSKGQIVANLANLAQNIWEPLYAQFPDAFITNSFREGETQAQHGTGQAMDIQFHGLASSGYLARAQWIRDNLPFDQLLLECLTAGALWVHVSFYSGSGIHVSDKPINKVAVMINNAGFTPGLSDLSTVSGVRKIPAA